jgi:hypothetical protein
MVALLLRGWSMFEISSFEPHFTALLGQQIYHTITSIFASSISQHTLALLLVFGQAVWFNFIIKKYELIYRHTWMPALCFVLCNSLFIELNELTPQLFANIALIAGFNHLMGNYKNEFSNQHILETGLLFGLAFLIEFQVIYFVLLLFYALPVLRVFNMREMLLVLIGFLVPTYFLLGIYFLTDQLYEATEIFTSNFYKTDFPEANFDRIEPWIPFIIASLLFLLGCIKLSGNYTKNMLKIRKFQNILIATFPIVMILAFAGYENLYSNMLYISIPASVYMAYYILGNQWGWWKELLVLTLIGAIIYNQAAFHLIVT